MSGEGLNTSRSALGGRRRWKMPSPTVNLVEDWVSKHRIESVSKQAKADLASMIDALAKKAAESEGDKSDWDPPV